MARLVRFRSEAAARPAWGTVEGEQVHAVEGDVYSDWRRGPLVGRLTDLQLLPPCQPATVVALAYNYKDLVGVREQYDEPLIFIKSPSTVIDDRTAIQRPTWARRVWVEVELAYVLRAPAFCVSREEASRSILGFTVANDVTAENVHARDHHLARSKSLETFCPVGRFLHTETETASLPMTTRINGRVTQQGTTANRILDDLDALVLISRLMRLQPGDLVLTGTPAGAMDSLVQPGDDVTLEIEGIGCLRNPIGARD